MTNYEIVLKARLDDAFKCIAALESGTRRLREHLPMLEEFLYYETIPDCHKEKLRTLIEALNSDEVSDG